MGSAIVIRVRYAVPGERPRLHPIGEAFGVEEFLIQSGALGSVSWGKSRTSTIVGAAIMTAGAGYSNFKDPLGLVLRMLGSRDPAAYAALRGAALEIALWPADRALEPFERALYRNVPAATSLPPILIVGPPRSGTTLVYQTLARHLPVGYLSNLSGLFPRSVITISKMLQKFLAAVQTDYHSYYGNTAGLSAPNDGFHIWNRWLGHDRYSLPGRLDEATRKDMRSFFALWAATFHKPLLNKNNRNTFGIELLSSVLDGVTFIIVERDPLYIAQSLLIARETIQGNRSIGWGLGSDWAGTDGDSKSPIDDVVAQIHCIDETIRQQKERVSGDRIIELSYELFCDAPAAAVAAVHKQIWGTELDIDRLQRELQPFSVRHEIRIEQQQFDQLRSVIRERWSDHERAS